MPEEPERTLSPCAQYSGASWDVKTAAAQKHYGGYALQAGATFTYLKPQLAGRLSFPLDRFVAGKNFVIASNACPQPPFGAVKHTCSVRLSFTRRR